MSKKSDPTKITEVNIDEASAKTSSGKLLSSASDKQEKGNTSRAWIFPVVTVLAIVPLIVIGHRYDTGLGKYPWFNTEAIEYDLFLYWKSVLIEICGALALFMMVYRACKGHIPFACEKRSIMPLSALGVLALMTIVSTIFSKHFSDALWGGYTRFEGCLTLLSYCLCFCMAYGYVRSEELMRYVLDGLLISAFIIGLIGTFQMFGMDFMQSGIMQGIIRIGFGGETATFTNPGTGISYATLYNPNYVGSYVVLVLPFIVGLVVKGIGLWRKIFAGVTAVLLLASLWGAHGDTGMIALGAGIVAFIILIFRSLKRIMRIAVVTVGAIGIAVVSYMLISGGIIENLTTKDEPHIIDNISSDERSFLIETTDGHQVRVNLNTDELAVPGWSWTKKIEDVLTLEDGKTKKELQTVVDENGMINITEEGYPNILFYFAPVSVPAEEDPDGFGFDYDTLHVNDTQRDYVFADEGGGVIKYIVQYTQKLSNLKHIERSVFTDKFSFATGRGYIWACTIPILKKYLLIGAGPDNFVYAFPNNDYVGANIAGYQATVVAYPHNMFMEMWVDRGLIALIAFILIYVIFIVRVLKLCFRRKAGSRSTVGIENTSEDESIEKTANTGQREIVIGNADVSKSIALFKMISIATATGTTAFMVAGLANDSNTCVTPVFWILLGLGYAAETMWKKNID